VVRRGERLVLDGVSFEAAPGEVFGLLGPNGAGKTTAFQILTGLLQPQSGELILDGVAFRPGDRTFRERTGIVFQDPALDDRLTARENLSLAARLYGVPRRVASGRIDDLLSGADLSDRADEPVGKLSGGMRRRLELARALVHEPTILILDEPTTGLDEASFRKTWSRLHTIRKERGLTLLLTTHRPEEAENCDRIAILDGGKIVACDTPDRLRARVRGDLVILESDDPESVAAGIREKFSLEVRVLEGRVVLERESAHELIPRLVETFPGGTLRSVSMRRAGIGEVFLELTGHGLDGGRDEAAKQTDPRKPKRRS